MSTHVQLKRFASFSAVTVLISSLYSPTSDAAQRNTNLTTLRSAVSPELWLAYFAGACEGVNVGLDESFPRVVGGVRIETIQIDDFIPRNARDHIWIRGYKNGRSFVLWLYVIIRQNTPALGDSHRSTPRATTFTFDGAGNQAIEQAPGGTTTTTWNYENQSTLVVNPDGSRVTTTYNADLRRLRKRT